MPDNPFFPGDDKVAPAITGGLTTTADQTARERNVVGHDARCYLHGDQADPERL